MTALPFCHDPGAHRAKNGLAGFAAKTALASAPVAGFIALITLGFAHHSSGQDAEASPVDLKQLPETIAIPRQTLMFQPTRNDITVGCVIVTLNHSNLGAAIPLSAIRVNGVQPKTPVLYLKRVDTNQFEMPAVKIEFSSKALGGPLYLTVKVWFNELTNQYDSLFYERTPDRYALVTYCTQEHEAPSKVNARLGANRVESLREFQERLGAPIIIKLNQRPLREEWGRWPMINHRKLTAEDLQAIERLVRGRGERHLIAVMGRRQDSATVHVGARDLFENTRRYELARTDGAWQIEKVTSHETGW